MNIFYEEILDFISTHETIDTHEHLPCMGKYRDMETDVLKEYISHYFNRDLVSAGMSREDYQIIIEEKIPVMKKLKIVEPYWELCRYTGYGRALDIANRKNLIFQIHTNIQEGNGNRLSNSNPELLSNLFLEYTNVGFDLFHIGYPYQNEITVLAKNFPNVYIDMCWAHIVSPVASINALLEWFLTIPLNKISAFGGDYLFIDGVYGHIKIAQKNVAMALSLKVQDRIFDLDMAKKVAQMLFYENPKNIFRLNIK